MADNDNRYEDMQCAECSAPLRRRKGVSNPTCSDCYARKARERFKQREEGKKATHI